jgi:hypothetical protein
MAVKINLLPADYTLTGPVAQFVRIARPLTVILLSLFIVTALGMGGFFVFSSISLKSLSVADSNLEKQIQTQSEAQQQIILLEDRLTQIKTVQGIPSAIKNLDNIDSLLTPVANPSLLSELDVDSQKTSASIVFKSNLDLTGFINSLSSNSTYSTISMESFSYSPASGYQVGLNFVDKN